MSDNYRMLWTGVREQIMHFPEQDESKFGLLTSRRQDVHPTEELTMDKFVFLLRVSELESCAPVTMASGSRDMLIILWLWMNDLFGCFWTQS